MPDSWITLSVVNDENAVTLELSRAEAVRLAATILVKLDQEGESAS